MASEDPDQPERSSGHLSAEAAKRLAKELDEAERTVREMRANPYKWSRLWEWLELDTWTVRQGLALLADIEPNGSDVDWDGFYNQAGVFIEAPQVNDAQLLSESDWFALIPTELPADRSRSLVSESNWTEMSAEIEKKRKRLRAAEYRLQRLKRLWDSGQRSGDRIPIMEFVAWAEGKKIEIPWKAWAIENGFLTIGPCANGGESPAERRERVAERHRELVASRVKNPTKQLADEERVSEGRIRQLIQEYRSSAAKPDRNPSSWPTIKKPAR